MLDSICANLRELFPVPSPRRTTCATSTGEKISVDGRRESQVRSGSQVSVRGGARWVHELLRRSRRCRIDLQPGWQPGCESLASIRRRIEPRQRETDTTTFGATTPRACGGTSS
jgi:hypothetical protein